MDTMHESKVERATLVSGKENLNTYLQLVEDATKAMFGWQHEVLKFADMRVAANMKLLSDVAEAKDAGDYARILVEHVSNMYEHISNTVVRSHSASKTSSVGVARVRPPPSTNTPSKAPANTPSKAPAASDRTSTRKAESLETLSRGKPRLKLEPRRSRAGNTVRRGTIAALKRVPGGDRDTCGAVRAAAHRASERFTQIYP